MSIFGDAPVFQTAKKRRKRGTWNKFAQRALERKTKQAMIDENLRLRLVNERLEAQNARLNRELEGLWNANAPTRDCCTPEGQWREDQRKG